MTVMFFGTFQTASTVAPLAFGTAGAAAREYYYLFVTIECVLLL